MSLKYKHELVSLNAGADKFVKDLRAQTEDPSLIPLPIWDADTDYPIITDLVKKFRIGELTIVGGFQAHGKSLLAQQQTCYTARQFMAHNALIDHWLSTGEKDASLGDDPQKLGVLYISLEMSWQQLFGRLLVQEHGYDPANLSDPTSMTDVEWKALDSTVLAARDWPITICDTTRVYVEEIQDIIDEVNQEWKVRQVVIDYLQLLSSHDNSGNEVAKLDDICKKLKEIALRNRIHIIAPSSMSRDKAAYMPTSQQLRGSQAIAFNADNVFILHRPYVADPDLEPKWEDVAILTVEKCRNAQSGQVRLKFDPKRLKFKTFSPRSAEELGPLPTRANYGGY